MQYIINAILTVLAVDVIGFVFWVASGQFPLDNFYVGTITAHIIRFVFGV